MAAYIREGGRGAYNRMYFLVYRQVDWPITGRAYKQRDEEGGGGGVISGSLRYR